MARPRTVSDEQIDAAAREVFLSLGPQAPVSAIGARLGVSHAALLQRVGSKEKLLLRSLSPGAPDVLARLDVDPPTKGAAAALVELLAALHDFHADMLPGLMVLRASGVSIERATEGRPPPTLVLRRKLANWLERTGELTGPRAGAVAEALLGAIEARCFNQHLGGSRFVEGEPRSFLASLVRELLPELEARSEPRASRRRKRSRP